MNRYVIFLTVFGFLLLGTTVLAQSEVQAIELPQPDDYLEIEGDINGAGSSTVFPIGELACELFSQMGFPDECIEASVGTGAGFERFCISLETDISNASRPIKDDERATCEANGIDPIEFLIGIDELTFVVSTKNGFVDDLSVAQLSAILSGNAITWHEVDMIDGEDHGWPNEKVELFSPGGDSGTFDYALEMTLRKPVEEGGLGMSQEEAEEAILSVDDANYSEDDNQLASGAMASEFAIAYFGVAYFDEYKDALKSVKINGLGHEDEGYHFRRPLFIYSSKEIIDENDAVAQFINFWLTHADELAMSVGYSPAPVTDLNIAKARWLIAMDMEELVPADLLQELTES